MIAVPGSAVAASGQNCLQGPLIPCCHASVCTQARVLQTFHAWFLCTMLTALQHARADVMAAPRIADPLTLAELLAKRYSGDGRPKH